MNLLQPLSFRRSLKMSFLHSAEDLKNPATRRDLLRVMAAAFGLAGLTACTRQPKENILPYVRQPEEIVLGQPLMYATAMPFRGSAVGLLVESHEGRPTKVEGNPQHPGSLGRTNLFNQASMLGLYDPDRSQAVYFTDGSAHGVSSWAGWPNSGKRSVPAKGFTYERADAFADADGATQHAPAADIPQCSGTSTIQFVNPVAMGLSTISRGLTSYCRSTPIFCSRCQAA